MDRSGHDGGWGFGLLKLPLDVGSSGPRVSDFGGGEGLDGFPSAINDGSDGGSVNTGGADKPYARIARGGARVQLAKRGLDRVLTDVTGPLIKFVRLSLTTHSHSDQGKLKI